MGRTTSALLVASAVVVTASLLVLVSGNSAESGIVPGSVAEGAVGGWLGLSDSPSGKTSASVGNLAAYWKLDEGTGTTASDSSGNGNNGTLVYGPTWVDGKYGKALSFDGVNDYVNCGNNPSLNITDAITVEAWAKRPSGTGSKHIATKWYGAANKNRAWALETEIFAITESKDVYGESEGYWAWSSANVDDNKWHHIVGTWESGTKAKIYTDGVLTGIADTAVIDLDVVDRPVLLAAIGPYYAVGAITIDEVRIYNRALTAEEILAHYNNTVGRYVFYNNSSFDGDNPAANADDDNAIATNKSALLPSQTATFANYTSYSRGINGVMVDILNLPTTSAITADDFAFKIGNDDNPNQWSVAPAPTSVTVRWGVGVGGSNRVTIIWADNAIKKQWLQVTAKANIVTIPDVFYFGNAVGDSGNSTTDTAVTTMDEMRARLDPHKTLLNPADIENPHDYNRSGVVSTMDEMIARLNNTTMLNDLNLITAP